MKDIYLTYDLTGKRVPIENAREKRLEINKRFSEKMIEENTKRQENLRNFKTQSEINDMMKEINKVHDNTKKFIKHIKDTKLKGGAKKSKTIKKRVSVKKPKTKLKSKIIKKRVSIKKPKIKIIKKRVSVKKPKTKMIKKRVSAKKPKTIKKRSCIKKSCIKKYPIRGVSFKRGTKK